MSELALRVPPAADRPGRSHAAAGVDAARWLSAPPERVSVAPASWAGPDVLADRMVAQILDEHPVLAGAGGREQLLAAVWLACYRSPRTRAAYARDLVGWLGFLQRHELDALAVTRIVVELYTREQLDAGAAAASVCRRLSAVSSFCSHLAEHGLLAGNPVAGVRRPAVNPDHTSTVSLSREQARALIAVADVDAGPRQLRTAAAVRLLVLNGLRVDELAGADVADLSHTRGHRVLQLLRKGARRATAALAPSTAAAVDAYLEYRAQLAGIPVEDLAGPLLATAGGRRLDQAALWRLVRRLARASGVECWAKLSPHSLRHTAITLALDAGASLRDVQDFAGHADPRTTRGYDHHRNNLDRHATYTLAAYLAD